MARPTWFGHSIGRNHSCQRPSLFLFVDTESKQTAVNAFAPYTEHSLELGVCCAVRWEKRREPKEQWHTFTDATAFWEILSELQVNGRRVWVVAHNAGFDFTLLGLWPLLESGEYKLSSDNAIGSYKSKEKSGRKSKWQGKLCIDGIPFHIETVGKIGRVNFTDLMNYYPCTLEEIGKTVGITKTHFSDFVGSKDLLIGHCEKDVEILKRAYLGLVKQWEDEQNGNWQLSAPALAWSNYRHTTDTTAIKTHTHEQCRSLEWNSYYGGECRAFHRGHSHGPVVHYDVNSLYPSIMAGHDYPCELFAFAENVGITEARELEKQYALIGDVEILTDQDIYPVRSHGQVRYPIGCYRTSLAGPELSIALQCGDVARIHGLAVYRRQEIFCDYVAKWWQAKKDAASKGDRAAERFAKLMLNSLYGKFAQRTPSWETDESVDVIRPWRTFPHYNKNTEGYTTARSVGWIGQTVGQRKDCSHTFPAIAAFVTSYARVKMRLLREVIDPRNVLYQDTDSLFVKGERTLDDMSFAFEVGDDIGQLRIVGVYNEVIIRGPKNYTADGKHTIAGIRKRDTPIGETDWLCERFERTPSIIGRDQDATVRSERRIIDVPGTNCEGGYGPDGWYQPINIGG